MVRLNPHPENQAGKRGGVVWFFRFPPAPLRLRARKGEDIGSPDMNSSEELELNQTAAMIPVLRAFATFVIFC